MGLFNRIKDPVGGTARVVSVTAAPHNATSGTCRMNLVIEAPGIAAFAVEERKICRVARWPQPGMMLPCTVDRANPERFDVDVKSIPDWRDQARMQAEMLAQQSNMGGPPQFGGVHIAGQPTVQIHGAFTQEQAAEALRQAEMATGMDLDGDGRVGSATNVGAANVVAGPAPQGAPGGDVVGQLERLAALHRSGALTDAEFAAQKARLMGG